MTVSDNVIIFQTMRALTVHMPSVMWRKMNVNNNRQFIEIAIFAAASIDLDLNLS